MNIEKLNKGQLSDLQPTRIQRTTYRPPYDPTHDGFTRVIGRIHKPMVERISHARSLTTRTLSDSRHDNDRGGDAGDFSVVVRTKGVIALLLCSVPVGFR